MPQILFRQVRTRGVSPNWAAIRREAEKALNKEIRPALIKKFRAVVGDWEHKPGFRSKKKVTAQAVTVDVDVVGSNAKIWSFVSRGTKGGYLIPTNPPAKSRDGLLHYQVDYSARTAPGGRYGLGTGEKSGAWVTPRQVTHPGVKAREFEEKISKDFIPEFRRIMENAMRRGARAAQRE